MNKTTLPHQIAVWFNTEHQSLYSFTDGGGFIQASRWEFVHSQTSPDQNDKLNRCIAQLAAYHQTHHPCGPTICLLQVFSCDDSSVSWAATPIWWGEESNQGIFTSAMSFAYSQQAITGRSCKHFCSSAPLRHWASQLAVSFSQRKPVWIRWIQWRGRNTQSSTSSWVS